MKTKPMLESEFYHDGRGPELQRVSWKLRGAVLNGFEYFNTDDVYSDGNLKNIVLVGVQVYSMATEEVHPKILATGKSSAAIYEVIDSQWLKSYSSRHLAKCKHYQIMFYDEIFDAICEDIIPGSGKLDG